MPPSGNNITTMEISIFMHFNWNLMRWAVVHTSRNETLSEANPSHDTKPHNNRFEIGVLWTKREDVLKTLSWFKKTNSSLYELFTCLRTVKSVMPSVRKPEDLKWGWKESQTFTFCNLACDCWVLVMWVNQSIYRMVKKNPRFFKF